MPSRMRMAPRRLSVKKGHSVLPRYAQRVLSRLIIQDVQRCAEERTRQPCQRMEEPTARIKRPSWGIA